MIYPNWSYQRDTVLQIGESMVPVLREEQILLHLDFVLFNKFFDHCDENSFW